VAPINALINKCTIKPTAEEGKPTICPIMGSIPIMPIIAPKTIPPATPPTIPYFTLPEFIHTSRNLMWRH
jgi:hypothetical protein